MRVRLGLLAVMTLLFTLVVPVAGTAYAELTCKTYSKYLNRCVAWVEVPDDTADNGTSSKNVEAPPRACVHDGAEIPCQTTNGYWHSGLGCYLREFKGGPADRSHYSFDPDMPERPAPGMVRMICTGVNGGGFLYDMTPAEAAPPPDPRTVAWQLIAAIDIQAGDIGLVPNGDHALVGMPTWMWVNNPGPQTTGPITRSTTTAGYTITIEARLAQVVYAMGDGATVTCAGANAAGTRYVDSYGLEASPTCGHRYSRPGSFTVTATSHWEVAWYGVGQAGTITLTLERTLPTTVREGHSVNR